MFLRILAHPVFVNLNFHMPITVDLSHPLIMVTGENGSGKSTLLHAVYYALRNEAVDGFIYRWQGAEEIDRTSVVLFDAEQHNPRVQLDSFKDQPAMLEFLQSASHGQVMLSLFHETFPNLPNGTILLLDEPEMALSISNQRRIHKMMQELVERKQFRIICATHSMVLTASPDSYVINLDDYINKNVIPADLGTEGASTIQ